MRTPGGQRRLRNALALTLGVAGVFGVAALVSRAVFEGPRERASPLPFPSRRTPPAALPSAPQLFQVTALEGEVDTLHDGAWILVQAGDFLSPDDVLRTPPGGRASLRRGSSEIEVRERVQLKLGKLANANARFDVVGGAGDVSAAVTGDDESLEIASAETRTVNRGQARWVVSGRAGRVHVATSTGEVKFSARGKEVLVRAGHESHANAGGTPSEPEGIPPEVLLSVFWPERPAHGSTAAVRGKTRPSSRVRVNGEAVAVDPDGGFAAPVRIGAGDNPVSVEAEDIVGRRKALTNVLRSGSRAPLLEPKKEDLWKKK
jgi:hypothetical protein